MSRENGLIIITSKKCKSCEIIKDIGEFTIVRERKDKLGYIYQPYCKECDAKKTREYNAFLKINNPDKYRQNLKRLKSFAFRKEHIRISLSARKIIGTKYSKLNDEQMRMLMVIRLFKLRNRGLINEEESLKYFNDIVLNKFDWKKLFSISLQ